MTANKIKARINELCSHFTFEYKGVRCGVDPISRTHFEIWYGDSDFVAHNIDETMTGTFFNGKALNEIAETIDIIDW